jgi:hypothetical protein
VWNGPYFPVFYLPQKKLKALVLPCIIFCVAKLPTRHAGAELRRLSAANGTCSFPQFSGSLVSLFSKLIAHKVKQVGVLA